MIGVYLFEKNKKAMKKVVVLMLGLMLSSISFAKENKDTVNKLPFTAKVSVIDQGKIELAISKVDKVAFIKLIDQKGNLIYDNKVYLKKGITQPFDISELPVGKYNLIIDVDNQQIKEVISVIPANAEKSVQIL